MKVALYGNVCGALYTVTKALRGCTGIDAHLYLEENLNIHNLPESEDPEIANAYPDWLHRDKNWDATRFFKSLNRRFINELNNYDYFITSDLGVALAPYVRAKVIFITSGADLTRVPFPDRFKFMYPTPFQKMKSQYMGVIQRRGISKAYQHWTQSFHPFVNAFRELKVPEDKLRYIARIIIDSKSISFKEDAWGRIDPVIREQLKGFRFKIFHPSRLMIKKNDSLVAAGQWKQNDLLFYGFAKFLKDNPGIQDACLVMPDRKYSNDIELAKTIIKNIGIEDKVIWIKGKTDEGFTKSELLNLYSISDLVVDEFGVGWFGAVVLEGLACRRPVMCYVDKQEMNKMYPTHPIISCNTAEAIASEIAELYFSPEKVEKLGVAGERWVKEFHSPEEVARLYASHLTKLSV